MANAQKKKITVVGAGLAGSECALQLADLGYDVVLYEMRDKTMTPAHKTSKFAELVCSNSFGSMGEHSAPGQLKWEAAKLNSHILKVAHESAVPAGQALGMDREVFSQLVTDLVKNNPRIEIRNELVTSLKDLPRPAVIATGPLTHEAWPKKCVGTLVMSFFISSMRSRRLLMLTPLILKLPGKRIATIKAPATTTIAPE